MNVLNEKNIIEYHAILPCSDSDDSTLRGALLEHRFGMSSNIRREIVVCSASKSVSKGENDFGFVNVTNKCHYQHNRF